MIGGARPPACHAPGADHPVTVAHANDVGGMAAALADAFDGYPWTDFVLGAEDRPQRLRATFEATLAHVGVPYGEVRAAWCPETGRVVGAAVALRPDRPVPPEAWDAVARQGAAAERPRGDVARAEELLGPLRPTDPGVTIATVGVVRDHRGRGIAARLLEPLVRVADDVGVATHLETSSEDNLRLYTRLGFDTTARADVDGGPTVWLMTRPAQ